MFTRKNVRKSRSNKSRSNKSRSNKRQRRHSKSYFSGGTCSSCGSCMNTAASPAQPLFKGGKFCIGKRRGGYSGNDNLPSFSGLPLRYYYGQNDYMKDPQDPSFQVAARQTPVKFGGKNKTKKTKRGGSGIHFSLLSGQYGTPAAFNPMNTIGDIGTSNISTKILSGNINPLTLSNPSVLQQPVNDKYNAHNMPLA